MTNHHDENRAAMLARQARELEALEREHATETAIAAAMPKPPARVHAFPVPWAIYKAPTLGEALALFRETPAVVPAWAWRDGCAGVEPLEAMKPGRDNHITAGPLALVLDVETVVGELPRVTLYWWTRAPGFLARARVDIENPGRFGSPWPPLARLAAGYTETRSPGGRVVRDRAWRPNLEAHVVADWGLSWATGDRVNRARHAYGWQADHDETAETGAAWAHACEMVGILAARVDAPNETTNG